jgi:hypothetical protein
VVTDPNLADAVLSEYIGPALEEKLDTLYGEKKSANPTEKEKPASFSSGPLAAGARNKGAVFLVDRKTRNVIWSDYVRPKNGQADEVNHAADKIATQLEKDKRGKQGQQ